MQVDAPTPDSEGLQQPQIPDTTQRKLEGFCLNTPLTLSQCAAAEVRHNGQKYCQADVATHAADRVLLLRAAAYH